MAFARQGQVLSAVQAHAHGSPGQHRAQRRHRRVAVRLHLLAAKTPAHAQALHRDLIGGQAQHMRGDFLRLGGVLGAGLDENLPALVHLRERSVRFEVEVFLPAEFELAFKGVRGFGKAQRDVAPAQRGLMALERVGGDGLLHGNQRG